jgi:Domain of unknown function (DUF3597)
MSIFGNIMSAIFGSSARPAAPTQSPGQTSGTAPAQPSGQSSGTASSQTTGGAGVDVQKVLSERAAQKKEKLDWRRSIVDLMKVLDLDSSLNARKQLASELGYKGELNGSAEMNIWLHKQVMQKLADNGGKVPADLMS